jgi:uncharacterized membrane protein YhaH (DUF805 family)
MDFVSAVKTCLKKYATFTGRAARPEFWWFVLFGIIARAVANIIDRILFGAATVHVDAGNGSVTMHYGPGYVAMLVGLALIVPSLAVGARRLHDIDRSGWWQLLLLIPIIGWLILIYWFVQPSQGPNSYGEGPEGPVT